MQDNGNFATIAERVDTAIARLAEERIKANRQEVGTVGLKKGPLTGGLNASRSWLIREIPGVPEATQ
jgi:hypothetical protein